MIPGERQVIQLFLKFTKEKTKTSIHKLLSTCKFIISNSHGEQTANYVKELK